MHPGANPSHFSITYTPTDRVRQPTSVHQADVHHIYMSQLSTFYHPIRTLDPDHVQTTPTSTTWVPFLVHPEKSVPKIRAAIVNAPMLAKLPPDLLEGQKHLVADAIELGRRKRFVRPLNMRLRPSLQLVVFWAEQVLVFLWARHGKYWTTRSAALV